MKQEHKDKPHVYIKENRIVIQQDDQMITINLSHAQMLAQELFEANQVLTKMEEKKKTRIQRLSQRIEECASLVQQSQKETFIECWNDGILRKAPACVLASCFTLDDNGWAVVNSDLNQLGRVGLFFSISTHEVPDIVSELWSWGSFDEVLCSAIWNVPPSQIPKTFQTRLIPFVTQECFLPAGDYLMGFEGLESLPCEYPQRTITLSRDVYLTRFPVTQILYWTLQEKEPSEFPGGLRPIESISWMDAIETCNLYSQAMGYTPAYQIDENGAVFWDQTSDGYRLPTEAEWESAARADQDFYFSGGDNPDSVAWFQENANGQTHQVGTKEPNSAHLYDMTGNVWEWVFDFYDEEAYRHTPTVNPVVEQGIYRVCRGGAYTSSAESMRISIRGAFEPSVRYSSLGFRMARFAKPTKER